MTCNVFFRKRMPSLHYELQACLRMKPTEATGNIFRARAAISVPVRGEHTSGCQDE